MKTPTKSLIAVLAVLACSAPPAAAQYVPEGKDTGYAFCICPSGKRGNVGPGSSCESFCGGGGGGGPSVDYGAIQRAQAEQAAREARQREAAAEAARRARRAMEQDKFEKDKREAVSALKGVSTSDVQLKGFSGNSGGFGLKGVDIQQAGLKTLKTGGSSARQSAWEQLACSAAIGTALTEEAKSAKTRGDFTEMDHLADQAGRAMDGGRLDVACDAAGPLGASFKEWQDVSKQRWKDFLKEVVTLAKTRVAAEEKLVVVRKQIVELRKKAEAAKTAPPAAAPAATAAPSTLPALKPGPAAPKPPKKEDFDVDALLAAAERQEAELTKTVRDAQAKSNQAHEAAEAFGKDPSDPGKIPAKPSGRR